METVYTIQFSGNRLQDEEFVEIKSVEHLFELLKKNAEFFRHDLLFIEKKQIEKGKKKNLHSAANTVECIKIFISETALKSR